MVDDRVLNAISALIEVVGDEGELIISARISPERLDKLAMIGAELEDLEDDGHSEPANHD